MMTLITATNKEYKIKWMGISDIDDFLRFAIENSDYASLLLVFTNAEETRELTQVLDEKNEKKYIGYTEFKGINVMNESAVITLYGGEPND